MTISQILIVAFIGEAVWETCKMFYQKGKVSPDRIGAAIIGLLLAFGARIDFLEMVGIGLVIPYLGYVVTGLLISRGANVVHDIWNVVGSFSTKVRTNTNTILKEAGDKLVIPKTMKGSYNVNVEPVKSSPAEPVEINSSINPDGEPSNLAKASNKLKNLGVRASRIIEIIKKVPKEPEAPKEGKEIKEVVEEAPDALDALKKPETAGDSEAPTNTDDFIGGN